MFSIKSDEAQALQWSLIFVDTYTLMKSFINLLSNQFTHLN